VAIGQPDVFGQPDIIGQPDAFRTSG